MKTHILKFAAILGLVGAMAAPANADHDYPGFAIRIGSGYIMYDADYRQYNRHRHYDRDFARYMKKRWKQRKRYQRQRYAHDLAHWHVGPRGDRFCAINHSYLKRDRGHKNRRSHRRH